MIFKVGDKVRTTKPLTDSYTVETEPKGIKGTVVAIYHSTQTSDGLSRTYPYDVVFEGSTTLHTPVRRDEIEPRFWYTRFWHKVKSATKPRDAERHFGTEETVSAFEAVQKSGVPVNVKGE
jgi:hypothetical protein